MLTAHLRSSLSLRRSVKSAFKRLPFAVIGAAGLAVGLALQGSLANFASGVLLILFKPFKAGNFIKAGGEAGTVVEVGILMTELKTPDSVKIIMPNSQVMGGPITNFSAHPTRRVDMTVGVSYGDDLNQGEIDY